MTSFWQDLSLKPRILTLTLEISADLWKNVNLGNNFRRGRARVFNLHMCNSCYKIFYSIPITLTFWPWSGSLTYKKIFLTFRPSNMLSLWKDLSLDTNKLDLMTLILKIFVLMKKLKPDQNFGTNGDRTFMFCNCMSS